MKSKLSGLGNLFLSVILVTVSTGLAGCGSDNIASPSNAVKRTTPVTAVLVPENSESRVREFQEKGGLSPMGAAFLALTKLEIVSPDENLYQFTATFPTNTQAEITLRLTSGQKYTPTAEERALGTMQVYNAHLSHEVSGTTYNMKLEYFLPDDTLLAASRGGLKLAFIQPPVLQVINAFQLQHNAPGDKDVDYDTVRVANNDGETTGTVVVLVEVIKDAGLEFVGAAEEVIRNIATGDEAGSPLTTAFDSALDVLDALDMSAEYQDLVSELDDLQVAAENPTNPLTQKAYAEDPGLKQSILNEIENARAEMKWDAAVAYLNLELEVALGLVGSPALSIAALPVTKWNAETIKQIMRERINNIRKMITRGSFRTDAPPTSTTEPTSSPSSGSTNSSDESELPPGTWLATYDITIQDQDGTDTSTSTDRGAFTFSVAPDGRITGRGGGHKSNHVVTQFGRTDAEGDYSFLVSGYVVMGQITEFNFTQPAETIKGSSTINDWGKPFPVESPIWAPMVPQGLLKLKSGESLKDEQNYTKDDGVRVTQTRILTIK